MLLSSNLFVFKGMGVSIQHKGGIAFLKQVPNKVTAKQLEQYKMSPEMYTAIFCKKNFDLQNQLKETILCKDALGETIKQYLEAGRENEDPNVGL